MVGISKKKSLSRLLEYFVVLTNQNYSDVDVRMLVLTLKRLGFSESMSEIMSELDSLSLSKCPSRTVLEKKLDVSQQRLLQIFHKPSDDISVESDDSLPVFEDDRDLEVSNTEDSQKYEKEKSLLRREERLLLSQKALDAKEASLMKRYGTNVNEDAIKVIHSINAKLQEYDKKVNFAEQLEHNISHAKKDLIQSQIDVQKQIDYLHSREENSRQEIAQHKQKLVILDQKIYHKKQEYAQLQKRINHANEIMNEREQQITLREQALQVQVSDVRKKHLMLQNQMDLIQDVKDDLEQKEQELAQKESDLQNDSRVNYQEILKKLTSQEKFAEHQEAALVKLEKEISHLKGLTQPTAVKKLESVKQNLMKNRHSLEKYSAVLEEVSHVVDTIEVGDFEAKNILEMIDLGSNFLDSDLDRAKQIYSMIQETYAHLSQAQQKIVRNNVVSYYNSIIRRQRS